MPDKIPTPEEFAEITRLAAHLSCAKLAESEATADRIAIEAKLAVLIPGPEEGQRTINLANKGKVVVTRGINYKADLDAIDKVAAENGFHSPTKSKSTCILDEVGYRWYKENQPGAFALLSQHVEAKPKKVAVTIKAPK